MNSKDKYTEVQVAALRLLGHGDYTLIDITSRLIKKGFEPSQVNQDLELLVSKKWISDERVAQNIWEFYKGQKGHIFIRQKMQLKQVSSDIVESFFQGLKDSENSEESDPIDYKLISRQLGSRYSINDWSQLDPATKNKIYGYLARRGFTNIQAILSKLTNS